MHERNTRNDKNTRRENPIKERALICTQTFLPSFTNLLSFSRERGGDKKEGDKKLEKKKLVKKNAVVQVRECFLDIYIYK
jgi:hypothetical protein